MNVREWLDKVAYKDLADIIGDGELSEVYKSKFDGSYITHVGLEDDVKFLADREITEELTHGVGFSPKENKWYGWSHRAIYGFEPGSTCKKGDCHYRATNIEDELQAAERFWSNENHKWTKAYLEKDGSIYVEWEYEENTPNKTPHNTIGGCSWDYDPKNFGRGEWVAKTMGDAKQMAVDFNNGVS